MAFKWTNRPGYICVIDLFENEDYWNEEHRLIKNKYQVNEYVATLNDDTKIIAHAIVGWLLETKTLHIEFFAIDPSIRGKGLSYSAWNSLLDFVQKDFNIVTTDNLLIEAYFKNITVTEVNPISIDEYDAENKIKQKVAKKSKL